MTKKKEAIPDWFDFGAGIGIVMLVPLGIWGFIHLLNTPNPDYDRCVAIAKEATTTDSMPVICHQWFRDTNAFK